MGELQQLGQLVFAMTFPIGCLFLLLWLARLEDTLTRDVRRSSRKPDPAPVLRVPARQGVTEVAVTPVAGVTQGRG